jgi:hypothetical protein
MFFIREDYSGIIIVEWPQRSVSLGSMAESRKPFFQVRRAPEPRPLLRKYHVGIAVNVSAIVLIKSWMEQHFPVPPDPEL